MESVRKYNLHRCSFLFNTSGVLRRFEKPQRKVHFKIELCVAESTLRSKGSMSLTLHKINELLCGMSNNSPQTVPHQYLDNCPLVSGQFVPEEENDETMRFRKCNPSIVRRSRKRRLYLQSIQCNFPVRVIKR